MFNIRDRVIIDKGRPYGLPEYPGIIGGVTTIIEAGRSQNCYVVELDAPVELKPGGIARFLVVHPGNLSLA